MYRDEELYKQWAENPTKQNMSALVKSLMPIINREVQRQSGSVPTSVLRAKGMEWAIKAVHTYDPNRNVKLSTHVANYVQKMRRTNYKMQNAVRLPEPLQIQFGTFKTAVDDLSSELDREPTDDELAGRLGWKKVEVTGYRGRLYQDFYESAAIKDTATTQFSNTSVLMDMVRDSLNDQELAVYENQLKDKSQQLSNAEMAQKLGINHNRLQYVKRKVVEKARNLKNDMGHWT